MRVDLIKSLNRAGRQVYLWLKDGKAVSPQDGFSRLRDAMRWYKSHEVMPYTGHERRKVMVDRRSGIDRRARITPFDRRQRPQGRRWIDQVQAYQLSS